MIEKLAGTRKKPAKTKKSRISATKRRAMAEANSVIVEKQAKRRYVGRPLKYETVEELEAIIDEYFDECAMRTIRVTLKNGDVEEREAPKTPTVSELAYRLDMSRKQLIEYSKRDIFRNAITRAKRWIESQTEPLLFVSGISHGVTFNLKNNFEGWEDRSKVDENVTGNVIVRNTDYKNAEPEVPEGVEVQPL